jgi:adenine phosphoribosyltransferase
MSLDLTQYIASIKDFPTEGIMFRDVTPIVDNPEAYHEAVRLIADYARKRKADLICGPESRGFVFGCPVAYELGLGFAMVRKPGKLPRETVSCKYDLEYGSNELFMHKDSVKPGQRVVVVDDLLATGGTAMATAKMIEELGGVVAGFAFIIELEGLPGRENLKDYDVFAATVMTDK